ncbi:hypothetical protein C1645_817291 [Glomus cerebriforme]|uniref:Uncharacterized protein n=1 Tax=Glomus cerebriforme TaxID=658196 RepID=A0A397TD85_9GLOM|nr:hypothetical protein C1645_817291 [Glomus cerebriforme]
MPLPPLPSLSEENKLKLIYKPPRNKKYNLQNEIRLEKEKQHPTLSRDLTPPRDPTPPRNPTPPRVLTPPRDPTLLRTRRKAKNNVIIY